jgi:hypothetical protein
LRGVAEKKTVDRILKMKNTNKYLSYTKAWELINAALKEGFHLEAVAVEESIISDRILSYVAALAPSTKLGPKSNFGELISKWRKLAGASLIIADGTDLGAEVDAWRDQRNRVIHGLVKSSPGTPTEEVDTFMERSREAAEKGKSLARAVQNWHQKILRASRSAPPGPIL